MPRFLAVALIIAGTVIAAAPAVAPTARAADAQHGSGPPAEAAQDEQVRGTRLTVGGRRGFGRTYARKQPLPPRLQRMHEERFGRANPAAPEPAPPRTPPAPSGAATGDGAVDPPLDALRRADPPRGVPAPDPRRIRPSAFEPLGPRARAAAPDDFELWRSQPVAQGAGITSTIAEPTVANDRNALLFTGNWHAAISGDNGLTWSYLNPATQFSSLRGGFCCDQVAYAVDRGSYSLIFWLLQYADDGVNGGALKLVVYQGRNELLDQANYCEHTITPATINESGAKWFDFNVMSSTDDHLFVSTKVLTSSTNTHVTGAVVRWDLDDFDDGDCSLSTGRVYKNADGSSQNTALAQGAGSTMYWGKRTANGQIDIWELPDGTDTATRRTRTVSTWAPSGRGQSSCPVPDGTDPCARANDKLNVAFIHDGKLAFAWNVAQGNGFAFPHIRMARFDLPGVTLVDEPDIWHPDYAWSYAAAGINSAGHLGLSLYRIGGGSFPRARVALVDDVDTNIFSLNVHGIITSDAGTAGTTRDPLGRWGDYAAVRPYGNCPRTFAGAVHSQQGGNLDANSEHRFVWFGRESDGCADLVVTDIGVAPLEIETGDDLLIGETTRNIGSATAGPSTTRFYLSRDDELSDDDLRVGEVARHGSLDAGESQGLPVVGPPPAGAIGSYYVIACADHREDVDELTDTNNCLTGDVVTVQLRQIEHGLPLALTIPRWTPLPRRGTFTANLTVRLPAAGARRGWATVWLARGSRRTGTARLLSARRLPVSGGRTIRRRVRARVPDRMKPGDYRVLACVDRSRRRPRSSRCLTAQHRLHVVRRRP